MAAASHKSIDDNLEHIEQTLELREKISILQKQISSSKTTIEELCKEVTEYQNKLDTIHHQQFKANFTYQRNHQRFEICTESSSTMEESELHDGNEEILDLDQLKSDMKKIESDIDLGRGQINERLKLSGN